MPYFLEYFAVVAYAVIAFGASVFMSRQLPLARRFGTSLLMLSSFTYLLVGCLAFVDHSELIEGYFWSVLISPYLNLGVYRVASLHGVDPFLKWTAPSDFRPTGWHFAASFAVITVSTSAIVAALLMLKSRPTAFYWWAILIALSVIAFGYYLLMAIRFWGLGTIQPQILWEGLLLAAFFMAPRGQFQETGGRSK